MAEEITRKELHAKATQRLREIAEEMNTVATWLRQAMVHNAVQGSAWGQVFTAADTATILESMATCASQVKCEDCGKPVAECDCEWANVRLRDFRSMRPLNSRQRKA